MAENNINLVQYQGYMDPGQVLEVVLIYAPELYYETAQIPTDENQNNGVVEFNHETVFEKGQVVELEIDVLPDFPDQTTNIIDDDPNSAFLLESVFAPYLDPALNFVDVPNFFDHAQLPNDEDDPIAEHYFEPWVDYSAQALIYDGTYDAVDDEFPNLNAEDDIVHDANFESWGVEVLIPMFEPAPWEERPNDEDIWHQHSDTHFQISESIIYDSSYEQAQDQVANDEDDVVYESYFEPWLAPEYLKIPMFREMQVEDDPELVSEAYFEPWIDYSAAQAIVYDGYLDQVDDDQPNPDEEAQYESYFEPWADVVHFQTALDVEESQTLIEDDDPISESYFEPWVDYSGIVYDISVEAVVDQQFEEDDVQYESYFEPWTDHAIDFPIAVDIDEAQQLPDDDDLVQEFAFEGVDTLANLQADFVQPEIQDEDDLSVEAYFEPWTDHGIDLPQSFDFDNEIVNDEDDSIVESYFEPWTPVAVDTLAESGYIFDSVIEVEPQADPDSYEYNWEPWTDYSTSLTYDPTVEFQVSAHVANDEDDPVFESYFEPWSPVAVDTLAEAGYIFEHLEQELDQDDPSVESYFEPWADPIVAAGETTEGNIEDDQEFAHESYFEPWTDHAIDFPTYFDALGDSQANDDDDAIQEAYFEPWTDYNAQVIYLGETTEGNVDEDPEIFLEAYFEPWVDYSAQVIYLGETSDPDTTESDEIVPAEFNVEPWVDHAIDFPTYFDFNYDQIAEPEQEQEVEQRFEEKTLDEQLAGLDFTDAFFNEDEQAQDPEQRFDPTQPTPEELSAALDFYEAQVLEDADIEHQQAVTPDIIQLVLDAIQTATWNYDYELQFEPVADPDAFDYSFDPWTSIPARVILGFEEIWAQQKRYEYNAKKKSYEFVAQGGHDPSAKKPKVRYR